MNLRPLSISARRFAGAALRCVRRTGPAGVIAALAVLGGCHERTVTTVRSPHPARLVSPDSARYGRITLTFVREVRRPTALGRFPDGGVARELAAYLEVEQHAPGRGSREIGRLLLTPVRRHDYGNIMDGEWHWIAPNRLRWRVEHGYSLSPELVQIDGGEIEIPPLAP